MNESQDNERGTAIGAAQQWATRGAFLIAGVGLASWAPLVPYAKARTGSDEAALGLLLLCLGLGSICTMPVTGALAGRFGCRVVVCVATVLMCAAMPLLAVLSRPLELAAALFLFGAGVGTVDVAMNIQAVMVEKAAGRAMMSGFHGCFSLGAIVGAGGVSGLLGAGLSPLPAVGVVVALILALLAGFGRHLLPMGGESGEPLFAWPRGKVALIAVLSFVVFLAEGSMLDWGALLLTSAKGFAPERAGLGYAAFAVAMTGGRLKGDWIVERMGRFRALFWGGLCAAAGLGLAVVAPGLLSLLGFALVGLGAANIVPVLFSVAGQQTAMPGGLAIAAITTIGYAGILAGPGTIGFVAHATSLEVALGAVAVGLLGVAAAAARVVRE